MESSHTFKSQSPIIQNLNPGLFSGVMVGETDVNIHNNTTNITQDHEQFALKVDGGEVPATLAYRFVPLKVESATDNLEDDDLELDPILRSDAVRLTLVSPQDNQVYVVDTANVGQKTARSTPAVLAQKMTTAREEKRRVTHNEVERRRRDKINNWICKLAKILPDGADLQSKSNQSKGGILSKACDHIEDLRQKNDQYQEKLRYMKAEMSGDLRYQEVEALKQENASLRNENALLKEKLKQHGLMTS